MRPYDRKCKQFLQQQFKERCKSLRHTTFRNVKFSDADETFEKRGVKGPGLGTEVEKILLFHIGFRLLIHIHPETRDKTLAHCTRKQTSP